MQTISSVSTNNKFFDVNYLLSKVPYDNNILEYYDNVTYNIRFYMLNKVYQNKLSRDRINGIIPNNYRLPDDSKIIIAETGVTPNYDITSLKLNTVYSSVAQNSSATTCKIEMVIKEVAGCSLLNKIVAVSKMLGYENYILQPFHIDIWFSGYEQATGKPVKIIDNQVFTYEVIMGEVKSQVDNSGATYNMVLIHSPKSALNKTIQSLGNIGVLNIDSGTVGEYKKAVEEYINDKFFENNKKIKDFYKSYGDGKFLTIGRMIDATVDSFDESLAKVLNDKFNSEKPNNIAKVNVIPYGSIDIENVRVGDDFSAQYTEKSNDGQTRPSTHDTFDTFFQNLCLHTPELKDYVARPVYRVVYLGNSNGQEIHKIYADIVFRKNSYMEYFNEYSKSQNASPTLYRDLKEVMASKELRRLISSGALNKKYEWLYNGRDTSVLEMNSSLDMLWYANVPYVDSVKVNEASTNFVKQNTDDVLNNHSEFIRESSIYKESLESVIKKSNVPLNGIRTLASDKRLYVDDIYNVIDDKSKAEYLNSRKVLETYDEHSDVDSSSATDINVDTQNAKVGYNNIFQAGNLVELNITILGDPYWIGLVSDNQLYANNDDSSIANANIFPHFSFKMKTTVGQKENGDYNLEDAVYFSTIYQLVESVSIFESGKFTQQLKGVINNAFMYNARLKV